MYERSQSATEDQGVGNNDVIHLSAQAFLWENITMTDQETLGGEFNYGTYIKARGQVLFSFGLLSISLLADASLVFGLPSRMQNLREL